MRNVSITLYEFSKLPEVSQIWNYQAWLVDLERVSTDDATDDLLDIQQSILKLFKKFEIQITGLAYDASIEDEGSSITVVWHFSRALCSMETIDIMEVQRRLRGLGAYDPATLRGTGECKLTGVVTDEWLLDELRQVYLRPDGVVGTHQPIRGSDFIQVVLQAASRASQAAIADQITIEAYRDRMAQDECLWTYDGTRVPEWLYDHAMTQNHQAMPQDSDTQEIPARRVVHPRATAE